MERAKRECLYGLLAITIIFMVGALIENRLDKYYTNQLNLNEDTGGGGRMFYAPELDSLGYYDEQGHLKPEYFESKYFKYMEELTKESSFEGSDMDYELAWDKVKKKFNL